MALSVTVKGSVAATLTRVLDLATGSTPLSLALSAAFSDGAGINQANLLWHDQRTITASATDSLDLAGSLTDAFGQAVVFARIKALVVKAAAANANNVNVTRPASNGVPLFLAAGDGIPVKPAGFLIWVDPTAAGVVVTATTGDLIDLINSAGGTSVVYDIVIIGAAS